jgi:hypothetical protein
MSAPLLADFLAILDGAVGGPWETGNNVTPFGNEREARYPRQIVLSNGQVFPLTNGTDWCGIFAGWAYAKAAGWPTEWPLPVDSFYTPSDVAGWKNAGRWIAGPDNGEPGDLIYFDWKSDADRLANHVGTVIERRADSYLVVEGNVGSPSVFVRRTLYAVGVDIVGFGRPDFAPEHIVTPEPPQETDMTPFLICDVTRDKVGDPVYVVSGLVAKHVRNGDAYADLVRLGLAPDVPYSIDGITINPAIERVAEATISTLQD